jgi:hypothetical protein
MMTSAHLRSQTMFPLRKPRLFRLHSSLLQSVSTAAAAAVSACLNPGRPRAKASTLANRFSSPLALPLSDSSVSTSFSIACTGDLTPSAATQLAKLSGFSPIIATSSPSNFKLLRELGATHTLDRNAVGALGAEVAKITSEPVLHAFDAWSSAETQQEVYDLLAPKGKLVVVLDKAIKEVEGKNVTVRHIFGSVHLPENQQLGVRLFAALEHLLVTESIKVTCNAHCLLKIADRVSCRSQTP